MRMEVVTGHTRPGVATVVHIPSAFVEAGYYRSITIFLTLYKSGKSL